MTRCRSSRLVTRLALLACLLPLSVPAGQARADITIRRSSGEEVVHTMVVLRGVYASEADENPLWRRAVLAALSSVAKRHEVVLCGGEAPSPVCSRAELASAPALRWKIDASLTVHNSLAVLRVPLTLEIVSTEAAVPDPGLLILEDNFVLPPDLDEAGRDDLVGEHLRNAVLRLGALDDWFARLRSIPGLQTTVVASPPPSAAPGVAGDPGGNANGADVETTAAEPPDALLTAWQENEDHILGLLIDDRFAEARRAAEELLEEDRLPAAQRERVSRLLETAVRRQAAAAPAEADPAAEPTPEPEPFDYSFSVRVAVPGEGFLRGVDGRLRLFDGGVRFAPSGEGDGWTVRWSQLEDWGEADGLWDVGHPLMVAGDDGRRHYFAQIDHRGRFISGAQILSLLERGAQRAARRR